MPQNFRPYRLTGVGTTAADIPDGSDFDSFDNITGLHLCNTATSGILVDVFFFFPRPRVGCFLSFVHFSFHIHTSCPSGTFRRALLRATAVWAFSSKDLIFVLLKDSRRSNPGEPEP